jgi:hypothetical protein
VESTDVDNAGVSVKVPAHYPGRPLSLSKRLPKPRGGGKDLKESAEPIVVGSMTDEGANLRLSARHRSCNMKAETANRYARTDTSTGSTARSYRPQPVRLAEIEKPGGGERGLGIPTVVDRMIQQAMHQVLNPLFDHEFSDSSFGYRKGKSAEQAVR